MSRHWVQPGGCCLFQDYPTSHLLSPDQQWASVECHLGAGTTKPLPLSTAATALTALGSHASLVPFTNEQFWVLPHPRSQAQVAGWPPFSFLISEESRIGVGLPRKGKLAFTQLSSSRHMHAHVHRHVYAHTRMHTHTETWTHTHRQPCSTIAPATTQ